jgi:pimeloyl-ACP methyl ester carboxylesterase
MIEVMRLPCLIALVMALAPAAVVAERTDKPRWETLPLPPAMPKPHTKGFVDAGGAKIYYATYGKGTTPVILLHGGLGNADHFSHQVHALAGTHRVIAIDSRGQGRSTLSKDKAKLSYHVMAEDVIAVMDELGLEAAALVGWSDGGAIALDVAIHHPARVTKLFVLGTNYDASGSKSRRGPTPRTFSAYTAKCKSDFHKLSHDPSGYEAATRAMLPVWREPSIFTKDQLRAIKAPAVIAVGDHDEIIAQEHVQEMASLIPAAKHVVFKDTSHFALWQDPETFNKTLVEFLTAP